MTLDLISFTCYLGHVGDVFYPENNAFHIPTLAIQQTNHVLFCFCFCFRHMNAAILCVAKHLTQVPVLSCSHAVSLPLPI
jgi:hypothetical protein